MKKTGTSGGLRISASLLALSAGLALPVAAQAQNADEETVVVTGIRGSLERSMDVKRNAVGVVDAISAEDIGKFPDTNLAESLQRITGVSIERVNGEGSGVTVRGFGPGFNLVTLNGRTLPTADVSVIGARGNFNGGGGRAFDFSNLASEGVSALEVYKTGQSVLPSGGIGATVNIRTRRPFETSGGFEATIGGKLIADQSVESGDDLTPEVSGLMSWSNPNETFGVSAFGSYSRRDSGAPSQQINDWIVFDPTEPGTPAFLDNASYNRSLSADITNPPASDQKYAIPQDSRYDFADITRERINGQLVLQFRPMDNLTLTGDYTFAENESDELRYEQTNWFATPMDQFIFDTSGPVATPLFMQENNNGEKDMGFEQTNRATRDTLQSLGFNAEWELNGNARVVFDAHSSRAESGGNNPLGHLATFATIGAPVILQHSVDYRSGFPIQSYTIDDSSKGNNNGVLDVGDLGTQVFRSTSTDSEHEVNELDLRYVWENSNSSLTVGVNYRDTELNAATSNTQQDLGSWGIANPGDVEQYAPGVVESYCLSCTFDDLPVGQADVAFRADAVDLWNALVPVYVNLGNAITTSTTDDVVEEDILSFFAQFTMEGEFIGLPTRVSGGVRYEETELNAASAQQIPQDILWTADNDFLRTFQSGSSANTATNSYEHVLPNLDFQIDLQEDLVLRASFNKTIGRPAYNQMYASVAANAPNRPTVLGGQVTANSQNPFLVPLESDNFDVSLEWYYGDASYLSAGFFRKDTRNFIGNEVVDENLFNLRDVTSGIDGSRSGTALGIIRSLGAEESEANLFTLTALIDNRADVATAQAEFEANLGTGGAGAGALPQGYVDTILGLYDLTPDANDPLMVFANAKPVNGEGAVIDGWEIAWQHFLGDTGFGIAANYTLVNGDELDPDAPLTENQFAIEGLSDTANITLIYENYGLSARLAYNWRDTFLLAANQGGDRSGIFVEDYGQYDMSVTYDLTSNVQLSFEGINLLGEDQRQYHRVSEQIYYAYELSPRYVFGARYKF